MIEMISDISKKNVKNYPCKNDHLLFIHNY